jgi:hypothetical protein
MYLFQTISLIIFLKLNAIITSFNVFCLRCQEFSTPNSAVSSYINCSTLMWRPYMCSMTTCNTTATLHSLQYIYTTIKWDPSSIKFCKRKSALINKWSYKTTRTKQGLSFIHSFIHSPMALQPFVRPWFLLQFLNLFFYTDGRTPWTRDQPVARPLPTRKTTQT